MCIAASVLSGAKAYVSPAANVSRRIGQRVDQSDLSKARLIVDMVDDDALLVTANTQDTIAMAQRTPSDSYVSNRQCDPHRNRVCAADA